VVDEVYTHYPFFGTRQMASYLKKHEDGWKHIKRHHTRWAYEKLCLQSVAPGPHTSKPHPEHPIYPYLLKNAVITAPNQVWSTDITYIRLRHGFIYLMAIIDWYSRFVLDWELSISLENDFCVETLKRVLANGSCDIFNTDQGAQFTSHDFVNTLKAHDIKISMDGRGRALDNIFVERLWRSLKYECVYLHDWETVRDACKTIKEYFHFYNRIRPHQSLDGRTPSDVHFA
jgi:putative transposase